MAKKPPSPRPRSAEQTRADILRAARVAFATRGYGQAGIRDIAKEAGITAALVVRYFGSKRDLFLAAVAAEVGLASCFAGEREGLGQRVVAHLMSKPIGEVDTQSMLLLGGAADDEIRDLSAQLIQTQLTKPLAKWLGGADAEARAALILALISGVWTYRVLLPIAPIAGPPDAAVMSALASMLQDLVDSAVPRAR